SASGRKSCCILHKSQGASNKKAPLFQGVAGHVLRQFATNHLSRRPFRGLCPRPSDQLSANALSALSCVSGRVSERITYWSPKLPPVPFSPLPRSRSFVPVLEPGGLERETGPDMVGTSTRAPRTASARVTGRVR